MGRISIKTAGALLFATLATAGLLCLAVATPAHAAQPTITVTTNGTGHVATSETDNNVRADSNDPAKATVTLAGDAIYVAFTNRVHYSYLEYIDISDGTHTYRIGEINLDDYNFSFVGASSKFQMNNSEVRLTSTGVGGNINISCGLRGIADNLTITAVYHPVDPLTLTIYRNFSADDDTVLEKRSVYPYEAIGAEPAVPQRDGYRFVGWSRTPQSNSPFPWDPADTISSSQSQYAIWEPIEPEPVVSHNLVFRANDGSADDIVSTTRIAAGDPMGVAPTAPQRDGYEFLGWAASPTATEPIAWDESAAMPGEDVVFYAVWKKIESTMPPESPETNPPSQPETKPEQAPPGKQEDDPAQTPTDPASQQKGAATMAKTGDASFPLAACLLGALGASAAVGVAIHRRMHS